MNDSTQSQPQERPPASPFWNFSLRLYASADVPAACISLQEVSAVDVNVLLFCLFAASAGRSLAADDVRAIIDAVDPWKAGAVVPLRAARVYLRAPVPMIDAAGAAALRQRVKAVELEAERLQQEALYRTFPVASLGMPAPSAGAAARHNMAALETAMSAGFNRDALDVIVAAFEKLGG